MLEEFAPTLGVRPERGRPHVTSHDRYTAGTDGDRRAHRGIARDGRRRECGVLGLHDEHRLRDHQHDHGNRQLGNRVEQLRDGLEQLRFEWILVRIQ